MKIVILADCLTTQNAGIYYYVRQWITRVIDAFPGHEFILILAEKVDYFDLEQIIVPIRKSIPFHQRIRQLTSIPRKVNELAPDWVIETAHFGPFFISKNINRATIIHDLTPITHPQFHDRFSVLMHKSLMSGIIKRSQLIITNSETTKSEIVKYSDKREMEIVVNYPQIDTKESRKVLSNKKTIITIGTIEPRKDQITLLKAFAEVAKVDEQLELTIIGKNGWKNEAFWEYLSSMAEDIRSRVNVLDYISRDRLIQELSNASIFVFPSIVEGFGLPILEAMSHKLPIILSDTPINREVGGKAALYFELGRYEDLALAINQVISQEGLKNELSQKSGERHGYFESIEILIPFLC